tara:strand:- start:1230 stop:1457 length:228 start_codon:yes stop_codon:yes gene_type:complete
MTGIIRNKVNRFYKQNVGTIVRTLIYTAGHFCIAAGVIMAVADVTIYEAMTDAVVEPLLNSIWYFILDKWWASRK